MIRYTQSMLLEMYQDYVDNFDPTPQYLYDEPYHLKSFQEWSEDFADDVVCMSLYPS